MNKIASSPCNNTLTKKSQVNNIDSSANDESQEHIAAEVAENDDQLQSTEPQIDEKTNRFKKLLHRINAHSRLIHFRQIRGKDNPKPNSKEYVCINCNHHFSGNYCNNCGQKSDTKRLTKKSVLYYLFGGISSIDSGFLLTLKELITRPGYMINDFIEGKRARYLRPFQLLFVLAAIYIVITQLIDPQSLKVDTNIIPEINVEKREELSPNTKSLYLLLHSKPVQTFSEIVTNWAKGNKAAGILFMLPIFALATTWAFRKRKFNQHYNYTEMLFTQTYIACQMLLVALVFLVLNGKNDTKTLFAIPTWVVLLLSVYTYKQLFRDTWLISTKRTLLMYFYSFLVAFGAIICVALMLVLATLVFHLLSGESFSSFWTK